MVNVYLSTMMIDINNSHVLVTSFRDEQTNFKKFMCAKDTNAELISFYFVSLLT